MTRLIVWVQITDKFHSHTFRRDLEYAAKLLDMDQGDLLLSLPYETLRYSVAKDPIQPEDVERWKMEAYRAEMRFNRRRKR